MILRWIISVLLFIQATQGYTLSAQFRDHSTALDSLRTVSTNIEKVMDGKFSGKCVACEVVVEVLQMLIKTNTSETDLVYIITKACILLKIEDERVCSYVVSEFSQEFITVAAALILHPAWLCYAAVGPECGEPLPDIFPFWNVTIPPNKPKPKPLVRPQDGLPTLKVVQLSDIHIDLLYKTGSNKKCGEPLCCRQGVANSTEDQAGFWGTLGADCDIPLRTFENALKFISQEIKPDLVFWTGDIPGHDVWNQSRDDQIHVIWVATETMATYLPNTTVLPSIGNHESAPVDSYPPPGLVSPDLSNAWLNTFLEKAWARWLPPESLDTVGYAGFYAVQPYQNLRIISLNTQYCDNLNFWLYLNNTDPGGQLQWLVDELSWAEQADIKVIILGHIPTGKSDCLKVFSWNYYKIIDRFESTVVGQYLGHTHQDEYSMFYSEDGEHHPTGFQLISPSLTTYKDMRPSIRVYTLDGVHDNATYRPLESKTYILDLERANTKNETVWELEYVATKAYNITWLTPGTMQGLYERLAEDRAFFTETYWKYMYHSRVNDPCDDTCYANQLCRIITGRSHDPSICPNLPLAEQRRHALKDKMC